MCVGSACSSSPGTPAPVDCASACPCTCVDISSSATGTDAGASDPNGHDSQVASTPSPTPTASKTLDRRSVDPSLTDPGLTGVDKALLADLLGSTAFRLNGLGNVKMLVDARRDRFMAREALAGMGVRLARSRLGVHPPTDARTFARQEAVRQSFIHAWKGYEAFGFGTDHLKPVSKTGEKGLCDMGLSIVDSLDTMIIMDLPDVYFKARQWVSEELTFQHQEDINLFETTIRVVGGLLGAHELSGDKLFLDKALELADRMLIAFNSSSGVPFGTLGLKTKRAYNPSHVGGFSSMSEVGTTQVEFRYLSHHTGDTRFSDVADRVMLHLRMLNPVDGLYPMFIDPVSGYLIQSTVTLGARGDSVYEYLLKQFLVLGKNKSERMWLLGMYNKSVAGVLKRLLQKSTPSGLTYIAEQVRAAVPNDTTSPALRHKMDHLVCFFPGVLALGARFGAGVDWEAVRDEALRLYVQRYVPDPPPPCGGEDEPPCPELGDDVTEDEEDEEEPVKRGPATDLDDSHFEDPPPGGSGSPEPQEKIDFELRAAQMVADAAFNSVSGDMGVGGVIAGIAGTFNTMSDPRFVGIVRDTVRSKLDELVHIAANLTETCYRMYTTTKSGLAPEIVTFHPGGDFRPNSDAAHSLLRPETVESIFVMHRLTGDPKYLDWGWKIFEAIERNARVPSGGYSGVKNVNVNVGNDKINQDDKMDSFFLAETLKYLYLLFSEPSLIPLDEYVFNTEAHPLRMNM